MEPGPESIGIAIGVSEMSSLVRASLLSAMVMRLEAVTIPHAVLAHDQAACNFQDGQGDAEKVEHESSEQHKRNQDGDDIQGGF
jgi:hypothetical protein